MDTLGETHFGLPDLLVKMHTSGHMRAQFSEVRRPLMEASCQQELGNRSITNLPNRWNSDRQWLLPTLLLRLRIFRTW